MGEIKHVQGPLEVCRDGPDFYGVRDPSRSIPFGNGNVFVASLCTKGDATLFAAAPEMKEALEEVLRWDAYPNASCRKRIEAALARADGEAGQ